MTSQAIAVDVVRALSAAPELRAAKDDSLGVLSGYFSKFNNWYRVSSVWEGDFLERTAPGFTAQTIAEDRSGMRVLFDHGFDPQIGNKVLGPTRELREDDIGPYYEVDLMDTSYNRDLYPGLKAGQYGASFRMRVQEDSWNDEPERSDYNPLGIPERTITRAKVMEYGPVTFPANPEATATVRSDTDRFYNEMQRRDRGAFEAACRAAGLLRPEMAEMIRTIDFTVSSPNPEVAGNGGHDSEPGKAAQSAVNQLRARNLELRIRKIL